jgi:hypothetical protein
MAARRVVLIAERCVVLASDFHSRSIRDGLDRPEVIAVVDEESRADLFAADEIFSHRAVRRDLVVTIDVSRGVAAGDFLQTFTGSVICELDATD